MSKLDETYWSNVVHQIDEACKSLTEEQKTSRETPNVPLPEGYVWTRTIFGDWGVIDASSKGVPYLDPAYETYWSM